MLKHVGKTEGEIETETETVEKNKEQMVRQWIDVKQEGKKRKFKLFIKSDFISIATNHNSYLN